MKYIILILAVSTTLSAQEKITLNKPIVITVPSITDYKPERLSIEVFPTSKIIIRLRGMDDEFVYPCEPTVPPAKPNPCTTNTQAEVNVLISIINTGNHTSTSLWRKIMGKLITDFPDRFPGGAVVQ